MREDQLRAFIAWGSGIPRMWVKRRREGRPPPAGQVYATVRLLTDLTRDATPAIIERMRDGTFHADQRVHARATFSIQMYREGADAAMKRLRAHVVSDLGALVTESGVYAVPDEEMAAWEPFTVVEPFPMIRELNAVIPRHAGALEETSDQDEERRGIELQVDYLQDTSLELGHIDQVPLTVEGRERTIER